MKKNTHFLCAGICMSVLLFSCLSTSKVQDQNVAASELKADAATEIKAQEPAATPIETTPEQQAEYKSQPAALAALELKPEQPGETTELIAEAEPLPEAIELENQPKVFDEPGLLPAKSTMDLVLPESQEIVLPTQPVAKVTQSPPATVPAAKPAVQPVKEPVKTDVPEKKTEPAKTVPESGIWEAEKNTPYIAEKSTSKSLTQELNQGVPSRKVSVDINQYLDVDYPGAGWVYLGENMSPNLLNFFGRTLNNRDTRFTLRAKNPGNSLLHFYKQDVLTGTYIDDYLLVTVNPVEYTGTVRISAPLYASLVPPNQTESQSNVTAKKEPATISSQSLANQQLPSSATPASEQGKVPAAQEPAAASSLPAATHQTSIQTTESSPLFTAEPAVVSAAKTATTTAIANSTAVVSSAPNDMQNYSADSLLAEIKTAQSKGDFQKAFEYLDLFFIKAVSRLDEGWYLKGQLYESNSDKKNIRTALDAYETLTRAYPSSIYWQNANERITYLKRFYFNIR